MFKSKITAKLSLYFAIALLIFAIIIASLFLILFRRNTLNIHRDELENRANDIAQTIPTYLDRNSGGMGGFSRYLTMVNDIAGTDVWVVDRDLNLVTGGTGHGHMMKGYSYRDLPPNAEELIDEVFKGKTDFSEDFSNLLSELTLTVGAPIYNSSDDIIGAVLLHSPVEGTNEAISQGIIILSISILLALIVTFLLSVILSRSFTRPLSIMKETALDLSNGEYSSKTNIRQDDEIGELATTIDLLAERLDKASQESEKLEIMRNEFIANVSHELKTPVTVMRGSLEALVDKVISDPVKIENYHIQMLNESKYLQRLVEDLLEISKLQSLEFVIEKSEISIYDLLDDLKRSAEHLAKEKEVKILVSKNTEDFKIMGDYGRIRQMIMIILDNAIKFSPKNETVKIVAENRTLYIEDNGIGISAEDLPYIFDRFYKSRSEQNKTGTGLGLAIAKNIAKRHSIKLSAKSKDTEGTKFIFSFEENNTSQK